MCRIKMSESRDDSRTTLSRVEFHNVIEDDQSGRMKAGDAVANRKNVLTMNRRDVGGVVGDQAPRPKIGAATLGFVTDGVRVVHEGVNPKIAEVLPVRD